MARRIKNPDKIRLQDMDCPIVLGYELDKKTFTPIRRTLPIASPGEDTGADPIGDGMFRMHPSGDVVDRVEKERRLAAWRAKCGG